MVRMNEEQGYTAQLTYALLDHFIAKDPQAFNRMGMGSLASNLFAKLPGWARVYSEMDANYSSYRQQPIEPTYLQKYPMENRRFAGTTAAGEMMGKMLGVSPIKGDYWIQETAPAIYSLVRLFNRSNTGNRTMAIGEALHILSEPTTFFGDQDLENQKNLINAQARADMRNTHATPEQRKVASVRMQAQLKQLNDIITAKLRLRAEHPLKGTIINLPPKKK